MRSPSTRSITVVFPSVEPVNLLGGIGVVSIAAGIAFQTVLGNMFAGLMLLSRGARELETKQTQDD